MNIPINHVIGTTALIGLVIAAGLSYTMITSYIETDLVKQQLGHITEHVALNIVEIVNLVNFANQSTNEPMVKVLNLPVDVGEKAYLVKIVNETETGCYVVGQLVVRSDVTAKAPIPLSTNQSQIVLKTDETETAPLPIKGGTLGVIQWWNVGEVHGGHKIVVWGLKESGSVTWAGIGVWIP